MVNNVSTTRPFINIKKLQHCTSFFAQREKVRLYDITIELPHYITTPGSRACDAEFRSRPNLHNKAYTVHCYVDRC